MHIDNVSHPNTVLFVISNARADLFSHLAAHDVSTTFTYGQEYPIGLPAADKN